MQRRFIDYRSQLSSKGTSEHSAIASGMGPIYGFDKFELDMQNNLLNLSTNKPLSISDLTALNYSSLLPLKNSNGAYSWISGAVVTEDGVLTITDSQISISLSQSIQDTLRSILDAQGDDTPYIASLLVTAYHEWVDSEVPIQTVFRVAGCYIHSADSSDNNSIPYKLLNGDLSTWYKNFKSLLVNPNEVIVGLYSINTQYGDIKNYTLPNWGPILGKVVNESLIPYNYKWPQNFLNEVDLYHTLNPSKPQTLSSNDVGLVSSLKVRWDISGNVFQQSTECSLIGSVNILNELIGNNEYQDRVENVLKLSGSFTLRYTIPPLSDTARNDIITNSSPIDYIQQNVDNLGLLKAYITNWVYESYDFTPSSFEVVNISNTFSSNIRDGNLSDEIEHYSAYASGNSVVELSTSSSPDLYLKSVNFINQSPISTLRASLISLTNPKYIYSKVDFNVLMNVKVYN